MHRFEGMSHYTVLGTLAALVIAWPVLASGQESEGDEEPIGKHKINFAFGYTFIPDGADDVEDDKGTWVPSAGVDYLYRIKHPWAVGVVVDQEFGEYLIIDQDLNRENATIVLGLVGLEMVSNWMMFGGVGVEFEKHKNLLVFRIGVEYEFFFGDGWAFSPNVFVDIKEEYASFAIEVAFGKWFG